MKKIHTPSRSSAALALLLAAALPVQAFASDCKPMREAAQAGLNRELNNIDQMRDALMSNTSLERQCIDRLNAAYSNRSAMISPGDSTSSVFMQLSRQYVEQQIKNVCQKSAGRIDDARDQLNQELQDAANKVTRSEAGQIVDQVVTAVDQANPNQPKPVFSSVWDRISKGLFQ